MRPLPVATLIAVGLHGAALSLLPASPSVPVVPREEPAPLELVLEIEEPPQPPSAVVPDLSPQPEASPARGRLARLVPLPAPVVPPASPEAVAVPLPSVSVAAPFGAPPAASGADSRGQQAIAGLFRGGVWLPGVNPGAEASGGSSAPRREPGIDPDLGGKLLRESMDRTNQARGLGFGGPVASAAHQACLSKNAPTEGAATFDVLTGPDGAVISVSVRGTRGGDWSSVAEVLRSILAGKRLQVPPGAAGVAVAVRVEAKLQLPSGKSPNDPAVQAEIRGLGVSGTFDLADLSGKVSRIVSARITNERRL